MKMLIKSNKGSCNVPPLQNIIYHEDFDEVVFKDDEKCSLLNKYFCMISKLEEENVPLPDFPSKTDEIIENIVTSIQDIVDVIKTLDPNKASGPDAISHKMLKICPEKIAIPLQIIFNKSLEQCKYPSDWKIANVIAIFKKGDSSLPSNYRPISLISCVGKIMERVVYKYVYNHLQRNRLIYEYQSGFLPKCSTVHQLIEMYNCILNALEKKEISCFVFCDFSKAFDKVWHLGLLYKMNSYGVRGNLMGWFSSYLQGRQQRVIIKNSKSSLSKISAGVPQGSVLGPLLFIIYINDIAEKLISLCRLFADDTSFSYSSHDESQIKSVIDHDLNELDEWSNRWLMSFNPNKTEIMMFSNTTIPQLSFSLNGENIPIISKHKHLGVTFSSNDKWNCHIENIMSSVTKHLNILRKLKYRLSRSNLEKLYLVYIRPIFEYACEVWDNCVTVNSNKLEKLQLEAARIVTGLPVFTKSENVYEELGWEKLDNRRQRRKLQLFYNIQNNNTPNYLCNLIPPMIQSTTIYPLRNGEDLIVPFCRLSLTNDLYLPSTVRKWNNLNPVIRNLDSVSKFKNELKKLDIQINPVPTYYAYGPRKLNIILTQIRCCASFLNNDLFKVHLVTSPSCNNCGAAVENAYHFFFECTAYIDNRTALFQNLSWLPETCRVDVILLTRGHNGLSTEENELIFKHVFEYIKKSKRFLLV